MTAPCLLVGAGGLGREVAEAVRAGAEWNPIGFLDDDPHRAGEDVDGLPVLGGVDVHNQYPDVAVVLCAGQGSARSNLARRLQDSGLKDNRYATVVHPSVDVPATCAVEAGSVLLAGCVLTAGVRIGRHVVCMPRVVLTHDDEVHDGATLCAGTTLGGRVSVGAAAYLGMSTTVRQGVRIGEAAVVGMGAVVLEDVPAHETWFGVPARRRSFTAVPAAGARVAYGTGRVSQVATHPEEDT